MLRQIGLFALIASQPAIAAGKAGEKLPDPATIVIAHNNCVLSDAGSNNAGKSNFFGAIVALVVPALVKISIDAAVDELTKVRTVKSKGQTEGYLYSRAQGSRSLESNMPGCITMVTGAFKGTYSGNKVVADAANGSLLPPKAEQDEILRRIDRHIGLDQRDTSAKLYSVLEVRIADSLDKTAFRYEPQYLRVFDLMPGNRADKQGLVYTISINGPGGTPDGATYAAAPISFGSVSAGYEVTGIARRGDGSLGQSQELADKLAKLRTGWLARPGLSETARTAYVQDLRNGAGDSVYMPFVIKADVVQTQKPSDAAKLIAKLLGGVKDGAAAKLGELVTPTNEFTASQALLAAEAAVLDAEVALTAAQNEVPPNQDKISSAKIKLQIAKNALDELRN